MRNNTYENRVTETSVQNVTTVAMNLDVKDYSELAERWTVSIFLVNIKHIATVSWDVKMYDIFPSNDGKFDNKL